MNIVVVIGDALEISIESAISLLALLALAIDNEVTLSWICCFFSNCVGILHVSRVLGSDVTGNKVGVLVV